MLANRFLSGRVKTLRDALDEAQSMLTDHAAKTTDTLAAISERLSILDSQSSSLASGVARIESNTADLSDQVEGTQDRDESERPSSLRGDWFKIRDELERRASDEEIDGRTRAAYGRVDRRRYWELIDKMRNSRDLSHKDAKTFSDALAIWQRHKNGRVVVSPDEAQRMHDFRIQLGIAE